MNFLQILLHQDENSAVEQEERYSVPYLIISSQELHRHEVWIQDILKINEMVREMEAPSKKKEIDALELSSQITRLLDHTQDDIEAYVPREIIDKMCKKVICLSKKYL